MDNPARLTIGPVLFHWDAETKRDFYARIADEAPVDTVYLGEVICSKRAPFFDPLLQDTAERLERGGKRVVMSSLAEVMLKRERKAASELAGLDDREVEVNNAASLLTISGQPHRIGQYFNTYNEVTMAYLAERGATHFTLPGELPRDSVASMAQSARDIDAGLEVQVFGRLSLALSARCYHARAHGRHKDNCQFVCEEDPDGMPLRTIRDQDFLAVNGIQTLSHTCLSLLGALGDMRAMGVTDYRLVPHSTDMVAVAGLFRDTLDGKLDPAEAEAGLTGLDFGAPLANGFWYGRAGHLFAAAGRAA